MAQDTKSLDREAAREAGLFMGGVAWSTIAFGLAIGAGYALTFVAAARGELNLLAAFFISGLLVYASYTILHESVHGNISGFGQPTRWYNEALGYASGFIMAIPLTVHRAAHLAHHRHTNDPETDPDMVYAIQGSPSPFSLFMASLRAIVKQYTFFLGPGLARTHRRDRWTATGEIAVSVGLRVALAMSGFAVEVLLLTVLANLLGNFIIVSLFAVAVHHPNVEKGRYVDTSTILFPAWLNGPITWLWLWQNYHSIHHLFPRVPFYRYASLFQRISRIMTARGAPIHRIG